ncbi:hypothetical protein QZQ69_04965 [Serratia marcescens]|uniref:hypothetical protein n=1 Tax=Serratia marcescens TaxID=615 RepID=UPI00275616D1|nr:hypothetical protein [Serratia marcescens]MDP8872297.1 hypothetical protein [Serratia marcescens]
MDQLAFVVPVAENERAVFGCAGFAFDAVSSGDGVRSAYLGRRVVAGVAGRRPARSVAADRLLASPEFRSVVKQAKGAKLPEKGQQVINRKMEARIANSPAWKSFFRTLTREEKQAIARVGIIGWLSGEADGKKY